MFRFRAATVAAIVTAGVLTVASTTVWAEDDPSATTTTEAPPPVETEAPPATAPAPTVTIKDVVVETDPPADTEAPAPAVTAAPDTTPAAVEGAPESVEPTTTNVPITHDETAVVTGQQVAVGDTGNNVTHDDNTPTGATVPTGGAVDTGTADAIGSRDDNTINQQADVVLTDEAVANILQIALILNIGAALANSGANGINSQPSGSSNPGAIGTGDASATGLDIDQYVTQAARTEATAEFDEYANQLAVSLWMGLASSNTGLNATTGTGVAGSGGGIGSGDATAIGNDSLTDVDQRAAVLGSGTSQTDITQRATVLNLGFALANSGMNNISGVAAGLLTASDTDDDQIAQDMFAMLLPALLASYGYGPGSGQIGTGDATAVGNRSETYTQQIAMAAASGDGITSIVQDILVANMGVAGANTGGNVLGGSYATLDPRTAEAVVKMAAFLASLLAVVHQGALAGALEAQSQGIEIPFGDLVLTVGGLLSGFDTQLTSATGARANIRQISIVLSLGLAKANTGLNTVETQTTPDGLPSASPALQSTISAERQAEVNTELAAINAEQTGEMVDDIATGPSDAGNTGLVIICQRINADDLDCLAPPPPVEPPVTPPTTTPPTTVPPGEVTTTTQAPTVDAVNSDQPTSALMPPASGEQQPPGPQALASPKPSSESLPSTGADIEGILFVAGCMITIGVCTVIFFRRKPAKSQRV